MTIVIHFNTVFPIYLLAMWNWFVENVSSLNILEQQPKVETESDSKVPPIVKPPLEEVPGLDATNGKSDSSEHELDSTETDASLNKDLKSKEISPVVSNKLAPEDATLLIPSSRLKEVTSSGLQALSTGFSNILSDVTGVVKSNKLFSDFITEEEKFALDKAKIESIQTEANPPWYGFHESEEMKTQILEISSSRRNLLREPPPGSTFQFSLDLYFGQAMLMLAEDQRLDEIRFDLVPKKISEENFWRNYFYRVHLVKQSVQLGTLKREEKTAGVGADATSSSHVTTDEIEPEEFVSDALDIQGTTTQLTQEELNQLKVNADPAGQEKLNEEAVFDDALDHELENFNPEAEDVKDDDFDYADIDAILKDS